MTYLKASWRGILILILVVYILTNLAYQGLYKIALHDVAEDLCLRSGATGHVITPSGDVYCVMEATKQLVKLN